MSLFVCFKEAADRFEADLASERVTGLFASSNTGESPPRNTNSSKHTSSKHAPPRSALEKAPVGRVYIKQRSADFSEEAR